jgi:LacI family transcriptional regulator
MNDIAAKAGVSQASVSYVLNNKQNGRLVGEPTRERILAAAALGYQRNQMARSMVTGKSRFLGFIVHAPELQSAARILAGVLILPLSQNFSAHNDASDTKTLLTHLAEATEKSELQLRQAYPLSAPQHARLQQLVHTDPEAKVLWSSFRHCPLQARTTFRTQRSRRNV